MKKRAVSLVFFLFCLVITSSVFAAPVVHDPSYSIELVASGLGAAHGVEIGPIGDIFVSNYQGSIFSIDKDTYAVQVYASGFSIHSTLLLTIQAIYSCCLVMEVPEVFFKFFPMAVVACFQLVTLIP